MLLGTSCAIDWSRYCLWDSSALDHGKSSAFWGLWLVGIDAVVQWMLTFTSHSRNSRQTKMPSTRAVQEAMKTSRTRCAHYFPQNSGGNGHETYKNPLCTVAGRSIDGWTVCIAVLVAFSWKEGENFCITFSRVDLYGQINYTVYNR